MLRRFLPFLLLLLGTVSVFGQGPDSLRVFSPDGKLSFRFFLQSDGPDRGCPFYEICFNDQPVVLPSRLGLTNNPALVGWTDWQRNLRVERVLRRSEASVWQPVWGERAQIPDRFNELSVVLRPDTARELGTMHVVVRAYDEGIAFRYFFPESQKTQRLELGGERTAFRLPEGTVAFYSKGAQEAYERRPVENWAESAELPLTLHLRGGAWLCLAVAEQTNAPRMRLKTGEKNLLTCEWFDRLTETSPIGLPWRVVLVGERPGDLLEHNYLIQNLNPPNQFADVSWIQPGKAMREMTLSTAGAKRLVDFAVEQHIDYVHFDAGWYGPEYAVASDATTVGVDPRRYPKGDLDLPEAIRYARERGRKVLLYVNHRALERQLDSLLPRYARWGVSGIKFGFVHVGSHRWTVWLHEAVKKAAQHRLVVDVHDEYRPSGFSRTYPNLLTQEGIRGNEAFPDATHNTVLPFTRLVAGAADYTVCFYADSALRSRARTTNGHQLALPVVFFSPLQFLFWYGKPEHFSNRADVEFWKDLPTVWDATRVLAGAPGEAAVVARRKGASWWVGAITNTEARTLTLDCSFLETGRPYTAFLYEDDGAGHIRRTTRPVTAATRWPFALLPSGGAALRIEPR